MASADRASAPHTYRVFGVTVESEWPLQGLDGAAVDPVSQPDVVLSAGAPLVETGRVRGGEPLYVSPRQRRDGQSRLRIYREADGHVLAMTGVGDFRVSGSTIVVHPLQGVPMEVVETHVLSSVMAFWLDQAGRVCLHGSAIAFGRQAVVFLSPSGGGKSSLLASLLRRGHGFVTDDIAVMQRDEDGWVVRVGVPTVRLWPDAAGLIAADSGVLPRVGDGSDKRRVDISRLSPRATEPPGGYRTAALALLERGAGAARDSGVQVVPVRGHEAVAELMRHSFVGRLVAATGSPRARLGAVVDLAATVPCCRLRYPSGYERMPEVAAAVERHVAGIGGERSGASDREDGTGGQEKG